MAKDNAPAWLLMMRAMTGTTEHADDANNPKIVGMTDFIARVYPEMAWYCAYYKNDATAWCGLAAAFCMTTAHIRPPFQDKPAPDTERWMWALAWADDPDFGEVIEEPVLGCVMVMEREGGGHVTFYERTEGSNYIGRGGNQSDQVKESSYAKDGVMLIWPKAAGPIPS